MTDIECKVVEAWRRAADDLDIQFSSPFTIVLPDTGSIECLGLIHHFGRRIGTIISVMDEPSSRLKFPKDESFCNDYARSPLASGYGEYQRVLFTETLDDWQFLGADSERPAWYTGKFWVQT
jgi:hypothetical protein